MESNASACGVKLDDEIYTLAPDGESSETVERTSDRRDRECGRRNPLLWAAAPLPALRRLHDGTSGDHPYRPRKWQSGGPDARQSAALWRRIFDDHTTISGYDPISDTAKVLIEILQSWASTVVAGLIGPMTPKGRQVAQLDVNLARFERSFAPPPPFLDLLQNLKRLFWRDEPEFAG